MPVVKNLDELTFDESVTYIIGENGSGKSTLLEAVAISLGFNPEGGSKNFTFNTRSSHSQLSEYITLSKGVNRPQTGYFLRSESFYNVATEIERLDVGGGGGKIINAYGGKYLHEMSHGESFWTLMKNRFSSNGLYILDEPEAALSPTRQMAMISRVHQLVKEGCQFVISTHSPILLSYPESTIYEIREGRINEVDYDETETYKLSKHFLNNHKEMLKILLEP